ncbi:MAG: hypothetical protein ACJATS_001711 [Psychroserpens sp.]|jgi:hypothetical protein
MNLVGVWCALRNERGKDTTMGKRSITPFTLFIGVLSGYAQVEITTVVTP